MTANDISPAASHGCPALRTTRDVGIRTRQLECIRAFQTDGSWYETHWYAEQPVACRAPLISSLAYALRKMSSKLAMLWRVLTELSPEGFVHRIDPQVRRLCAVVVAKAAKSGQAHRAVGVTAGHPEGEHVYGIGGLRIRRHAKRIGATAHPGRRFDPPRQVSAATKASIPKSCCAPLG